MHKHITPEQLRKIRIASEQQQMRIKRENQKYTESLDKEINKKQPPPKQVRN